MEAIPLANTAAAEVAVAEVAAALFSGWICRFGVPAIITSDRGAQFTSNIWNSLCLLLQIKHQPTTAYHSQANGPLPSTGFVWHTIGVAKPVPKYKQ